MNVTGRVVPRYNGTRAIRPELHDLGFFFHHHKLKILKLNERDWWGRVVPRFKGTRTVRPELHDLGFFFLPSQLVDIKVPQHFRQKGSITEFHELS